MGFMLDIERDLADKAAAAGFTQQGAVEVARFIGALTRLAGPRRALELGTGMGLTTYHILSNLPPDGVLDSVESDQALIEVARDAIGGDKRLRLHNRLGEDFIGEALGSEGYDLIFADTWPGKYFLLDEVLRMVRPGGIYVIDDMNRSSNWPDGHEEKARTLLAHLQGLEGWSFSYYTFGTGVGIGQKHLSTNRPFIRAAPRPGSSASARCR